MRLKALDQIHISSVRAQSLSPNEEFEVTDAVGDEILKAHPTKFEKLGDSEPEVKQEPAPISAKAEPAPQNKAEPAPANKAEPAAPARKAQPRRKAKS